MTKAEAKRLEVEANRRFAYDKKVRTLVGLTASRKLTAAQVTAAIEAGKTAEAFAAEVAALEPVGAAIYPLKAAAVARATQDAQKVVDRVAAELAEAGGVLAPYPTRRAVSERDYERAMSKYRLWSVLTVGDKTSYRPSDVQTGTMSENGAEWFIAQAQAQAAEQYDAFVCKLVNKIGDGATVATLDGSHVWGHSILTVTKPGGVERWKTQQIVNYSKFGLPYNQWPSRKVA